jgi:hypothetical protein
MIARENNKENQVIVSGEEGKSKSRGDVFREASQAQGILMIKQRKRHGVFDVFYFENFAYDVLG